MYVCRSYYARRTKEGRSVSDVTQKRKVLPNNDPSGYEGDVPENTEGGRIKKNIKLS